jgi:translation initiation factor IF-2
LAADLAELTGDTNAMATGKVIEAKVDDRRGNTATLIVNNGTLRSGQVVVSGTTYSPVRIMEDFTGKSIREAGLSTPVRIVGFTSVPEVGADFYTVENKKAAEVAITEPTRAEAEGVGAKFERTRLPIVPILIKADVLGTIDAIRHELDKFESDRIAVRVIDTGVGNISVADVQNVSATPNAIIVGFNVDTERPAADLAERQGVEIDTFTIIYELSEWLETALKERTPQKEEKVYTGSVKILKHFSMQKMVHVMGGRIDEGTIKVGQKVEIFRRDISIGMGTIKNLQQAKSDVQEVQEGEFGLQLETRVELTAGDYLKPFDLVTT